MAEIVKRKRVWVEDDATPGTEGHEGLYGAWQRLFGEKLELFRAVKLTDYADGEDYLMPNGHIAYLSYPGNSAIYREE